MISDKQPRAILIIVSRPVAVPFDVALGPRV